jgi:hypothetical protein
MEYYRLLRQTAVQQDLAVLLAQREQLAELAQRAQQARLDQLVLRVLLAQ